MHLKYFWILPNAVLKGLLPLQFSKETGQASQYNLDLPRAEAIDLSTIPAGIEILGKTPHAKTLRCLNDDWMATKGEACIKFVHRNPGEQNAQ